MSEKQKLAYLRLAVPRANTRGPMAFEQVLASLHGLLDGAAKKTGDEVVSFELVNYQGQIYFVVVTPVHLKMMILSQLYSQYADIEVKEISEYLTDGFMSDKEAIMASLTLTEPMVFPIKRHPQFEDKLNQTFEDPLGPIASSIAHLQNHADCACIQILISPVRGDWNSAGRKALRKYFASGPWKWDWFRAWFQKNRLSFDKRTRIIRSPIWGLALFIGKSSKISITDPNASLSDDDQDLERQEKTSSRHDMETPYQAAFDKLSRPIFSTNIRILYTHTDKDKTQAEAKIREILGTFKQFTLNQGNAFKISTLEHSSESRLFEKIRSRRQEHSFALSQEELATVAHLPTELVKTPGIDWVQSRKIEPPLYLPKKGEEGITMIGKTNFRTQQVTYGIRPEDRLRHVYIIGKTGMGKSTLLENMIHSDVLEGHGIGVVDPHGDLADAALRMIPKSRTNDVIVFDPSDRDWPIAFNMLEGKNQEQRTLIASGLIGVIKKLNMDSWGPRLEHFLRNTILALVEAPDTTLLGITRMLVDKDYRMKILKYVEDPMVRSFWETEFNALAPQKLAEAVGPIQNKVGQFLATPIIRNITGQPKSTLDIRGAMDSGKIVIVNLSKGKIGEDNATMLGSMMITKFQIDAMSRADIPEKDRRPFRLYVDEFQNFATDSFATILSEARKYKLALTMANQYIAQMHEDVAAAVFGNVGSLVSFQVGIDDARVLSEQFDEDYVEPIDLASLPKYCIYNRIMVDGLTTPVFSSATLPPPNDTLDYDPEEQAAKIINASRNRYSRPREKVEEKIIRWTRPETSKKDIQKEQKGKGGPHKPKAKTEATKTAKIEVTENKKDPTKPPENLKKTPPQKIK